MTLMSQELYISSRSTLPEHQSWCEHQDYSNGKFGCEILKLQSNTGGRKTKCPKNKKCFKRK